MLKNLFIKKNKFIIQGTTLKKYLGDEREVIIPEGITEIANDAFYGCDNLFKVELPDSLEKIGAGAFAECPLLVQFYLDNTKVTRIEEYTFKGCKRLSNIQLPDNLEFIGCRAFQNCTNLRTITIPKTISSMEGEVFEGCKNLTSIIFYNYNK